MTVLVGGPNLNCMGHDSFVVYIWNSMTIVMYEDVVRCLFMHVHVQSMNHVSLNKKAGLDVTQGHLLCRTRFS